MSKSKKILSLVMALAMAISVFSICSFAAQTTPTGSVVITADNATVGNSATVTITVTASASETFYAGPMSIPVTYDNTLFTLGTVTINDVFGSGVTEKITNTATAGKVILTAIPKTDGAPVAPDLSAADLVIATITFTSDASATGTGAFAVDNDQKSTTNPTGKFYIGSFDGSNPKTAELTTMGQTLNTTPVSVTVGAAVVNTLEIEAAAPQTPIIDTTRAYGSYDGVIYGIDTLENNNAMTAEATIDDCLTTTLGDAYLQITDVSGVETTGTIIEVLDADGSTVLETYIFVYFGDIDADGYVTAADGSFAEYFEGNSEYPTGIDNELVYFMAGDLDGDGYVTSADASFMEYFEGNSEYPAGLDDTQAAIAALVEANGSMYD